MTRSAVGGRRQRAVVLAGRGRYEDPWHDHAATSHVVADVVAGLGTVGAPIEVEVRGSFPHALDDIDLGGVDLVVVNAGSGRPDPDFDGDDVAWAPRHDALFRFAAAGGAVLALHQAANTFADSPRWETVLGGRWIPGTSFHPPRGDAHVRVRTGAHAITEGLGDFRVLDERYTALRVSPGVTVLAAHVHEGVEHALAWVNESGAPGGRGFRVVYDALGHDVDSYANPARRELLERELRWLLRR